ncbi:YheT family hydrolase [Lutibacter holmesii]|uniref:YheT family hydrolase n=1 Tax=Lutibacter holmesii TaxID=1137985 RepID=A0ABW3WQ07_9FLAO
MPVITSSYNPPFLFKNSHLNTIYKTLFFNNKVNYVRKRIPTPDQDFLDIDFSLVPSNTLVIALHGLEGSSNSKYIVSLVNHLNQHNIACAAINFRGCSGEDNNHLHSYHSGKTDDVSTILNYILNTYTFKNIILVGYSMGGNIALKYLGENSFIPFEVKGGIAISVPCDLEGSSNALAKTENTIYMKRFLRTLKKKSIEKLEKFPNSNLDLSAITTAQNFAEFDGAVTAPLFGFKNAQDYWTQSSSKAFLPAIKLPTFIINALDDTFLSKSCFPFEIAKNHKQITLETPKYGGHVGFNTKIVGKDLLWSENRIRTFIEHIIS